MPDYPPTVELEEAAALKLFVDGVKVVISRLPSLTHTHTLSIKEGL